MLPEEPACVKKNLSQVYIISDKTTSKSIFCFYLSPSLSSLNCLPMMVAKVRPTTAPGTLSSARPAGNRSMSLGLS